MTESCCDASCNCNCEDIPNNKMCQLSQPANDFNLEKVKQLTSKPKYICRCCGRTANDADNLCSPTAL